MFVNAVCFKLLYTNEVILYSLISSLCLIDVEFILIRKRRHFYIVTHHAVLFVLLSLVFGLKSILDKTECQLKSVENLVATFDFVSLVVTLMNAVISLEWQLTASIIIAFYSTDFFLVQ